jgi:hypothetical protein
LKGKKALTLNQQGSLKEKVKVRTKAIEELKDVFLEENEQAIIKVGFTLEPTQYQTLAELLHIQISNCVMGTFDMPGISPEIVTHQLKVDSTIHLAR